MMWVATRGQSGLTGWSLVGDINATIARIERIEYQPRLGQFELRANTLVAYYPTLAAAKFAAKMML